MVTHVNIYSVLMARLQRITTRDFLLYNIQVLVVISDTTNTMLFNYKNYHK